jgi:hypothetical protein
MPRIQLDKQSLEYDLQSKTESCLLPVATLMARRRLDDPNLTYYSGFYLATTQAAAGDQWV